MFKRKLSYEEIVKYRKTHGRFFYYNKEDSSFFVPNSFEIGKTVNWAGPNSWFFALAIVFVIVWNAMFI